MARWVLFFAAIGMLLSGCGQQSPLTLDERALTYVRTGAYDKAIETCDEAIRLNPQDAEAFLYRGRAYQYRENKGDRAQAIADFSEAIRIQPKDPEAYYSRSIAYRDQGEADKSAADEKMYRKLDPRIEQFYVQVPDLSPPLPSESSSDEPAAKAGDASTDAKADPADQDGEYEQSLKGRYDSPTSTAAPIPQEPFSPVLKPRYQLPDAQVGPTDDARETAGDDDARGKDSRKNKASNSKGKAPPGKASAAARSRPADSADGGEYSPLPNLRTSEPAAPQESPWAPRGVVGMRPNVQQQYQAPNQPQYRNPFPQRGRPTGRVPDPTQADSGQQIAPSSVPTAHLPGAYHNDFNP